jgi:hypothetical protein
VDHQQRSLTALTEINANKYERCIAIRKLLRDENINHVVESLDGASLKE